MSSRVLLSRILRCGVRCSLIRQQPIHNLSSRLHSVADIPRPDSISKDAPFEASQLFLKPFHTNLTNQRFCFSTSASAEAANKDSTQSVNSSNACGTEETNDTVASTVETENETDAESDLSSDDLKRLVAEKEELVRMKQKEIEKMQDKVLRCYAEMENVLERTKREADNSKKFAIQNFAKSLLDVADNLARASSVVKESFSKIDSSKDSAGAVPLLKTLLEGVEMTEKQLMEVFRRYGIEKFDPVNEHFDPNRHHAVFQMPDASKEPGTVAAVLKSGYMLYDRVLRPAEVGVIEAVNNETV